MKLQQGIYKILPICHREKIINKNIRANHQSRGNLSCVSFHVVRIVAIFSNKEKQSPEGGMTCTKDKITIVTLFVYNVLVHIVIFIDNFF